MQTKLLALSLLVTSSLAVRQDWTHDNDFALFARDAGRGGRVSGAVNGANQVSNAAVNAANAYSTIRGAFHRRDALADNDFALFARDAARGAWRGGRASGAVNGAAQASNAAVNAANAIAAVGGAFHKRDADETRDYAFDLYARDFDDGNDIILLARDAEAEPGRGGSRGGRASGAINGFNQASNAAVNAANAYSTIRGAFSGRDADEDAGVDFELYARDFDDEDDFMLLARDADADAGRGGRVSGAVNGANQVSNAAVNAANAYSAVRGAFHRRDAEAAGLDDFELYARGVDFEDNLDLVERSPDEEDFDFEMY